MKLIRLLLLPFSVIYGFIVSIRNELFDLNLIKSHSFNVPVISVGNITVGGTGKTPHIEYLVNLLKDKYKVAVISRGYKRKTKGFVLANKNIGPDDIGDEPYQIYRKFKDVTVAVCEKRVNGIEKLLSAKKKPNVILLDDAYQHRYVKSGLSILLIDYSRPISKDFLLPAGNLREPVSSTKRANIIIVTKVPAETKPIEKRIWKKDIKPYPYQSLFFSSYKYGTLKPVFKNEIKEIKVSKLHSDYDKILIVTGIAQPKPFIDYFRTKRISYEVLSFSDHHNFSTNDLTTIEEKYNSAEGKNKLVITTEKDAVRLQHVKKFPEKIKLKTFYLPVNVTFSEHKKDEFDSKVLKYVKKNKPVGKLHS